MFETEFNTAFRDEKYWRLPVWAESLRLSYDHEFSTCVGSHFKEVYRRGALVRKALHEKHRYSKFSYNADFFSTAAKNRKNTPLESLYGTVSIQWSVVCGWRLQSPLFPVYRMGPIEDPAEKLLAKLGDGPDITPVWMTDPEALFEKYCEFVDAVDKKLVRQLRTVSRKSLFPVKEGFYDVKEKK